MKSLALLLTLTLLTAINSFSQEEEYDVIEYYDVFINRVPMFSTKAVVMKTLGKPEEIKRVNGIEDLYWFDYYYKKSIIQIDPAGDFMGFTIVDSSFVLTLKSTKVSIGNSYSVLKKLFPKSFRLYTTTKSKYFRVRFNDNDSYLLFTIKNGIIIQAETWDDNT